MILALLALALFADGPPSPVTLPTDGPPPPPYWSQSPSVEDMARVYPVGARAKRLGGRATLDCAILPSGQATDCKVAQESPEGQGFGQAALSLAPLIVLGEKTRATPDYVGRRVRVPLIWKVDGCPALLPSLDGEVVPRTLPISSWGARYDTITKPNWLRKPNGDDMARVYPDRAASNGIRGRATINCGVTARGALTQCRVVSETPEGEDFGAASLKLADKFRMSPISGDCQSAEGASVTLPLMWLPPE